MSTSISSATAPPVSVLATSSFSMLPLARPMIIELIDSSFELARTRSAPALAGVGPVR